MGALVRILAAALPLLLACSLLSAGPKTVTPAAGTPTTPTALATEPPLGRARAKRSRSWSPALARAWSAR